jgi:hypothetical protein
MFNPAPAIVSRPTSPAMATTTTPDNATDTESLFRLAPKMDVSKMETSKTDHSQDPNVWVPQKIERSRAIQTNHPNTQAQGKTARRSLMQPQQLAAGHPFFPTLNEWGTEGVPVDCGPDWTWQVIEQAVARGPHRSAM